jgi:hypothetical protein
MVVWRCGRCDEQSGCCHHVLDEVRASMMSTSHSCLTNRRQLADSHNHSPHRGVSSPQYHDESRIDIHKERVSASLLELGR